MYLPYIQGRDPEKKIIDTFGGLNRSYSASDNEFADMENMSGRDFPYLVTREGREELTNLTDDGNVLDIIITDNERRGSYERGTGVDVLDNVPVTIGDSAAEIEPHFAYYNNGVKADVAQDILLTLSNDDDTQLRYPIGAGGIRGLVHFGNNAISYPFPNVINMADKDDAERRIALSEEVDGYSPGGGSSTDGEQYFKLIKSSTAATGYADNGYRIAIKSYDSGSNRASSLYKNLWNYASGSSSHFAKGSRLRIETYENGNTITGDLGASFFVIISGYVSGNTAYIYLKAYDKTGAPATDINEFGYAYKGTINNGDGVLITKLLVDANLLEVHQNRLWGTDTLGTSLYCSNATDFRDWEIDGTNAGGGYVDVPENSPWTAIKEYNGYLYAFKENKMYKIVGNTSLDYAAVTVCDIGCINHEAVTICDSVMYFLSRDGIYAFTGNLPVKVSEALATDYVWGRFASHGSKMYCSLDKADGETEFITYDTSTRLWHKEDDLKVRSFVDYTDGLYALSEDRVCYKLEGGSIDTDTPFSVTTKKYFYTFDQKSVTSAFLWLDMSVGATVQVEIAYDGGEFTVCGVFTNRRLKYIPIRLRYCDEFQIRISGTGFCRLKQIEFALGGGGRTIR